MHDHREFYVDLTRPLLQLAGEGRVDPEQVNVQLMLVPTTPGAATEGAFQAEKVEIISA